jgi:GDP-L-fucose synthase
MSKIVVTGAYGLVGSEFVGERFYPLPKNCDLRNQGEFIANFPEEYVSGVIHCAAKVGGLGANLKNKGEFFRDNLLINTNVIDSCRYLDIKKLICFLSTCVFPDKITYPLREDKIHLGEPHFSNYGYAYAKRMAEVQIRAYKEQYGLNYTCVIPCNIFGPNDNYNLENGHVIPSLIHKCYIARENGTDLEVWGSGKPLREFIYSKDVARITTWLYDNYNEGGNILVSTSQEISIYDIVNLITKKMGFTGKIKWNTNEPDGQLRKPSDNSKLRKIIPNLKFTPIEQAIQETVSFFELNYNSIRK